jgi:hypothetical protein
VLSNIIAARASDKASTKADQKDDERISVNFVMRVIGFSLPNDAEAVGDRGALPRLRGRCGRKPWSVASLARPMRSETVERCLACEADAVGNRGALPRLRGRSGRHREALEEGETANL